MVHSLRHGHEKTGKGLYSSDLNILISSSVVQRGLVGTRQLHDRTENDLLRFVGVSR